MILNKKQNFSGKTEPESQLGSLRIPRYPEILACPTLLLSLGILRTLPLLGGRRERFCPSPIIGEMNMFQTTIEAETMVNAGDAVVSTGTPERAMLIRSHLTYIRYVTHIENLKN